eukprot:CAMPEP_0177619796 /NCGR_PEP_ID=MMETSP0419_2-20121207/26492_1 /TAXON_ID=582737 /ORGANISM="Tetraselmis sp., Strain GSL018" /LENGTH=74 /DNA_ID=CAMNT_0019119169 /DNA_START=930 /DNA_END=1155 /DNA_ORIENTATION=-
MLEAAGDSSKEGQDHKCESDVGSEGDPSKKRISAGPSAVCGSGVAAGTQCMRARTRWHPVPAPFSHQCEGAGHT